MNNPAGVAFVLNRLGAGGAEKQVLLTATVLAQEGFAVRVYTLRPYTDSPRVAELVRLAADAGVHLFRPPRLWGASSLRDCANWLTADPRRAVWAWGERADALAKIFMRNAIRVSSLRSADLEARPRHHAWWRWLDHGCAMYISNSRRSVDQLETIIPGVTGRSRVLHNALDDHARGQAMIPLPVERPGTLEIVMLGNINVEPKGYDVAIEMARLAIHEGLPIRIRIAGLPVQIAELNRRIAEAGVATVVQHVGPVDDPFEFLRSGHVFLLASRFEGFSNALLEAMVVGLPCIATDVGDLALFAAQGAPIQMVPVEDPRAVLNKVRNALNDWASFRELGPASGAWVRGLLTPETFRTNLVACFRDLIPAKPESLSS